MRGKVVGSVFFDTQGQYNIMCLQVFEVFMTLVDDSWMESNDGIVHYFYSEVIAYRINSNKQAEPVTLFKGNRCDDVFESVRQSLIYLETYGAQFSKD
jgi:hypothetical protein